MAFKAPSGEAMSKAISVRCTSRQYFTPNYSQASQMGFQRLAKSSNPFSIISSGTGGKEYRRFQMELPEKPFTISRPIFSVH